MKNSILEEILSFDDLGQRVNKDITLLVHMGIRMGADVSAVTIHQLDALIDKDRGEQASFVAEVTEKVKNHGESGGSEIDTDSQVIL